MLNLQITIFSQQFAVFRGSENSKEIQSFQKNTITDAEYFTAIYIISLSSAMARRVLVELCPLFWTFIWQHRR